AYRTLERDRVLGGPVRMVFTMRRMAVTGQIERDKGTAERQCDRVPRVRVLRTAVDEHRFGIAVAPDQRADLLPVPHLDRRAFDMRIAAPLDPELLRVLGEQCELVVGHAGSRPQGVRPVQLRRPFHESTALVAAAPERGWGTPPLISAGTNW